MRAACAGNGVGVAVGEKGKRRSGSGDGRYMIGLDQRDDFTAPMPIKEALNDTIRDWETLYLDHLSNMLEAMKADVKVEGYFARRELAYAMPSHVLMGNETDLLIIKTVEGAANGGGKGPGGKIRGGVNEEGITYYNNLINELLANDIEPYVTLFHWDVPQALKDEYGGFLIEDDFRDYAELCFKRFGDRVKYWITMNEPWSFSGGGYVTGAMAPGRCSAWLKLNCPVRNSRTEPYIVTHNQLLAHAVAVNKYRDKYQIIYNYSQSTEKSQKGEIGITLVSKWLEPLTNSSLDKEARQRSFDFKLGWFMFPLTIGDYPAVMRSLVGNRLPKFSPKQADMVKGSIDFLGINYYTAQYAANAPYDSSLNLSYDTDSLVTLSRAFK
ncbi:hypothetical protein RHMOL_Rhmol13G0295800 [Rhododendron molle]|uniref:Uncharacterized protein n=1 Tax=Rhododendron molle TaxID=49168 RepID=A0ACC0LC14_RHOML|nr:hypothetical protein RHMOL_Rhmol13G0295800 [Rhododendron molle]